jgi:glycosyltransferase involved in cell wall biosynthesis
MTGHSTPLVSIIIPTYNYARFIGEALRSVRDQTYRLFEIIVIDDGSTDDTKNVVSQFDEVQYAHQSNQGIAAARNAGLRMSNGELAVFLDADDRLLPNALAAGVAQLNENPDWVFVSGRWEIISREGQVTLLPPPVVVGNDPYRAFLQSNYIGTVGQVMFRRSVLEQENGFDVTVPGCDDHELYLRLSRKYPVGHHGELVLQHRRHGANTSTSHAMLFKSLISIYQRQLPQVQADAELERLCQDQVEHYKRALVREMAKTSSSSK